jgi:hypothetical protein
MTFSHSPFWISPLNKWTPQFSLRKGTLQSSLSKGTLQSSLTKGTLQYSLTKGTYNPLSSKEPKNPRSTMCVACTKAVLYVAIRLSHLHSPGDTHNRLSIRRGKIQKELSVKVMVSPSYLTNPTLFIQY